MTEPDLTPEQQRVMEAVVGWATGQHPAPGEPDEPERGAGADATGPHEYLTLPDGDRLDVTSHATRAGSKESIWKSVIGATGGFGCERETFYRETVRDGRGYRLRFGVGEPVVFGIGVDVAHEYLMNRRFTDGPADASLIGFDLSDEGTGEPLTEAHVRELAGSAVRAGMNKARGRLLSEPWTDADWTLMADRLSLSVEKLLGLWPNRVTSKGEPGPEPDGTPPGPPIGWLDPAPDIHTAAQRKMHAPGVVGGRGITGQPDYTFSRDGTIVAWVDVKALGKTPTYPAKWAAGEAVAYDYMCAMENGGIVPEWHGYLEYRRVTKPYWALVTAPVHPSVIRLARAYFARWERALDAGDPDALSFRLSNCHKCDYREAIPDLGYPGCPIGGPSMDVAPPKDEDPAGD